VHKTICCNSTSNAPDDKRKYPKHVELRIHQENYLVASSWHFTLFHEEDAWSNCPQVSQFIYFCKTLYMFQAVFFFHHQELKTAHTASGICQNIPYRLAAVSNGLTNTWRSMCSFELLMMEGKTRLKHVEHRTEINKMRNVASCWLYSANILCFVDVPAQFVRRAAFRMPQTGD